MSIELRIHHTTGKITCFRQCDPSSVRRLIQELHPAKLFVGPVMAIADGGLVTVCATAHISHVDVLTTQELDWPKPAGASTMLVLPDEAALRARAVPPRHARQPGKPTVAHLIYDFLGGGRLHVEVRAKAGHLFEARSKLNRLFAHPALFCDFPGGGATVVNPASVVRVRVATSTSKMLPGVWHAELQTGW